MLALLTVVACFAGLIPHLGEGGNGTDANTGSNAEAKYKNALYIYLCGSTLETKNAIASKNITEMLESSIASDTAIIIETGGTRKWRSHNIDEDAIIRYQVKNGELVELERSDKANMGQSETLSSFLKFCNQN